MQRERATHNYSYYCACALLQRHAPGLRHRGCSLHKLRRSIGQPRVQISAPADQRNQRGRMTLAHAQVQQPYTQRQGLHRLPTCLRKQHSTSQQTRPRLPRVMQPRRPPRAGRSRGSCQALQPATDLPCTTNGCAAASHKARNPRNFPACV